MTRRKSNFRARVMSCTLLVSCSLIAISPAAAELQATTAAAEFSPLVFLRDVDPTIRQDIRYATSDNFTGAPVPGYVGAECMLRKPVALALANVQAALRKRGLSLKVYDCYRPDKAVKAFLRWANGDDDAAATKRFFPRLPKNKLLSLGYIAPQSNHSRGVAVDLTITPAKGAKQPALDAKARFGSCIEPEARRAPDDSVDMGTGFDCFDALSVTNSPVISGEQRAWRQLLLGAMKREGFQNYRGEWWHFARDIVHAPALDVDVPAYSSLP